MTICPIAIAVGCKKCPAFKICPLKGLLGDKPKAPEIQPEVKIKAAPQPRNTTPNTRKKRKTAAKQ